MQANPNQSTPQPAPAYRPGLHPSESDTKVSFHGTDYGVEVAPNGELLKAYEGDKEVTDKVTLRGIELNMSLQDPELGPARQAVRADIDHLLEGGESMM